MKQNLKIIGAMVGVLLIVQAIFALTFGLTFKNGHTVLNARGTTSVQLSDGSRLVAENFSCRPSYREKQHVSTRWCLRMVRYDLTTADYQEWEKIMN